jgi:Mce-associated membrane protein
VNKKSQKDETKEEAAVAVEAESTADELTESGATDESTEKADEPTVIVDEPSEVVDEPSEAAEPEKPKRAINWSRVVAYGVLPALALVLAMAAGFLKWQDNSVRNSDVARDESVQAAKDTTIKMLSYKPDSVEKDLNDARNLLTGEFRDSYTSLINDVVIPGAKEKQISAVASVPAAASVSAEPNHAVVLVFVNQTVVVGQDAPTDTASSVRVALDKVGDRWLISKFDPV